MILVDSAIWPHREWLWCHMISDRSLAELHDFAEALGVPRRGFQGDHYDIPAHVRARAVELGAVETTSRRIVTTLRATGMRLPPREREIRRT